MNENDFDVVLRRHLKNLPEDAELPRDAPLKKFGLDSMQAVELLFDLEDELGVVLPDEMMTGDTFATAESLRHAVGTAADDSAVGTS
ncbi:phosphopantetheine-binding protein [Lentzea sp. CA-135723]|uniref:phosphopantetheine-binding protein n=1 Tax=Lentzea sp. CA-135723 TaxID=3239950 RepID=UPI003D8D1B50